MGLRRVETGAYLRFILGATTRLSTEAQGFETKLLLISTVCGMLHEALGASRKGSQGLCRNPTLGSITLPTFSRVAASICRRHQPQSHCGSAIRWMPIDLGEFMTSLAFSCARVNFLSDRPAAPTGLRNPGVPADFPTGALSSKAAQSLTTREQKSATRRYGTLGHHLANLASCLKLDTLTKKS